MKPVSASSGPRSDALSRAAYPPRRRDSLARCVLRFATRARPRVHFATRSEFRCGWGPFFSLSSLRNGTCTWTSAVNHYSFVRPRWASVLAVCASASFSAITAYLDVVSGPAVRVFPIYFLPVALVAWRLGVRAACWSAVFATTAWELAHRFESGSEHHAGLTSIWNVSMLWMTFFGFACITGRLSAVLDQRSTESRQDALTELLNLRGFEERVQVECERAERYRTRLVVAFLDLDGFKFVNDSAGHAAGDRLLREVAEHLRRATRVRSRRAGGGRRVLHRLPRDRSCLGVCRTRAHTRNHRAAPSRPRIRRYREYRRGGDERVHAITRRAPSPSRPSHVHRKTLRKESCPVCRHGSFR